VATIKVKVTRVGKNSFTSTIHSGLRFIQEELNHIKFHVRSRRIVLNLFARSKWFCAT
jgi:hypothetical protein